MMYSSTAIEGNLLNFNELQKWKHCQCNGAIHCGKHYLPEALFLKQVHLTAPRIITKQFQRPVSSTKRITVVQFQGGRLQSMLFISFHTYSRFSFTTVSEGETGWASSHIWQMGTWRFWKESNYFCAWVDILTAMLSRELTIIQDFTCSESTSPTVLRYRCKCQPTCTLGQKPNRRHKEN